MRILVLSPIPTHPQNAGHRSRIFHLCSRLKELGHRVGFAYLQGVRQDRDHDLQGMEAYWSDGFFAPKYTELANAYRKNGSTELDWSSLGVDDWYDDAVDETIAALARDWRPDMVIVEYIVLSRALMHFGPGVKKVIDTMDVFCDRSNRLRAAGIEPPCWYSFSQDEECLALSRADLILAISSGDQEFFSACTKTPVVVLGYEAPVRPRSGNSSGSQRSILFLASGGQSNQASALRFLHRVLPKIQSVIPDVIVRFAGRVCDQLGALPDCCVKEGVVDRLDSLIGLSDVMVNAETFGTGLCIKNLTALQFGMPLVTSPSGARGIEAGAGTAFLVGADEQQIVDMTVSLLLNAQLRSTLSQAAIEFVTAYNLLQSKVMAENLPLTTEGLSTL